MCNAKDCEQYHPDNICCTCQNLEWYKLKQTLTEIKEIVETCMELNDCTKYILQKISEAENEITTR